MKNTIDITPKKLRYHEPVTVYNVITAPPKAGTVNTEPSLTQPGLGIDINKVMENFYKTGQLNIGNTRGMVATYDEDVLTIDPRTLDPTDRDEIFRGASEQIENVKEYANGHNKKVDEFKANAEKQRKQLLKDKEEREFISRTKKSE